jgi:hypothetical protein
MTTHADLSAAAEAAQVTLDRKRRELSNAQRYLDECRDGDPRKATAEQRVGQRIAEKLIAERAAYAAVDAVLDFEASHSEATRALTGSRASAPPIKSGE